MATVSKYGLTAQSILENGAKTKRTVKGSSFMSTVTFMTVFGRTTRPTAQELIVM
jgi:hypothetical protein